MNEEKRRKQRYRIERYKYYIHLLYTDITDMKSQK